MIPQRTGIEQRHGVDPDNPLGASDLGGEASRIAMQRAGWNAEELTAIFGLTPAGAGDGIGQKGLDTSKLCTGPRTGRQIADLGAGPAGAANQIADLEIELAVIRQGFLRVFLPFHGRHFRVIQLRFPFDQRWSRVAVAVAFPCSSGPHNMKGHRRQGRNGQQARAPEPASGR